MVNLIKLKTSLISCSENNMYNYHHRAVTLLKTIRLSITTLKFPLGDHQFNNNLTYKRIIIRSIF